MGDHQLKGIGKIKEPFELSQKPHGIFDGLESVEVIENGPIYLGIEAFFEKDNSKIRVEYRIYKERPYVDVNVTVFWQDMISFWRDMLVFKTTPTASKYLDLTDAETEQMASIAGCFTKETLLWQCRMLDDALVKMSRSAATARMTAELTLIRMCDERLDERNDSLLSRISKLEDALMNISISGTVPTREIPADKPKKEPKKPKAVTETAPEEQKIESTAEKAEVEEKKADPQENTVDIIPQKVENTAEPDAKSNQTRTLRPLRCWVEVLEDLAVNDFLLWMDINTTKAFTDENGNAIIVFESDLFLERASKHGNVQRVAELLSKQIGKPTAVSFELLPEDEYRDSVIDDFLENYEN
jgi:DNA polymerase III gamma/tau subunit